MLLVPDLGERTLLEYLRAVFNASPLTLRLFQNNFTPSSATLLADVDECDFDSYAGITLNGPWSIPTMLSGRAFIALAPQVWTASGGVTPNDVYGYYVVSNDGATLLWAERFPAAPIVIDGAGDQVTVTPSLTLRSEPP